jgi:ribose/xylose/arabinose/galactoside ABC-type transport system permease subunit
MKSKTSFLTKIPSAAWVILLMMIIFSCSSNKYLTLNNIVNIIQQNAVLLIVALGSTLVLLSEGIDLSLGSVLSLSGVVCALVMRGLGNAGVSDVVSLLAGVAAGLLTGMLMGAITGGLISITRYLSSLVKCWIDM